MIISQIVARLEAGHDDRPLLRIAARRELQRNHMVDMIRDVDHWNRLHPSPNPIPVDGPGRELERSAESLGFDWGAIVAEARS